MQTMGRNKNQEKVDLIKKLGVEGSKHNFSLIELKEKMEQRQDQEDAAAEAKAMTDLVAGDVPVASPVHFDFSQVTDPFSGLTERQKLIARLRMRSISQEAIARIVGVSQPVISKELGVIKDWQLARGKDVNQHEVVGSTMSLYEEIESKAWELFHDSKAMLSDKAKSLAVVMQAREKHTKLLMDLGLIKKAAQEINHKVEVNPFIENWTNRPGKQALGDSIVVEQLKALPEPSLDDYEDAVIEEDDTPVAPVKLAYETLKEPTPDEEDFVLDDE